MKPEIVVYSSKDKEGFKNLVLQGFKNFGFSYHQKYDSDLDNPEVYSKKGGVLFLSKIGGKVVGAIAVISNGDNAELKRWYVYKEYQGKGYGTLLLEKAIQFCIDKKFKYIEFETNKKFTKAHRLYKKKGFSIISEDERSYYMGKILVAKEH